MSEPLPERDLSKGRAMLRAAVELALIMQLNPVQNIAEGLAWARLIDLCEKYDFIEFCPVHQMYHYSVSGAATLGVVEPGRDAFDVDVGDLPEGESFDEIIKRLNGKEES